MIPCAKCLLVGLVLPLEQAVDWFSCCDAEAEAVMF